MYQQSVKREAPTTTTQQTLIGLSLRPIATDLGTVNQLSPLKMSNQSLAQKTGQNLIQRSSIQVQGKFEL